MNHRALRRVVTATAAAALIAGGTVVAAAPAQAATGNYLCSTVVTSGTTIFGSGCTGRSIGGGSGGAMVRSAAGGIWICYGGAGMNEQAALKRIYLATLALDPTGKGRARWTNRWKAAPGEFDLKFDGRVSAGRRRPERGPAVTRSPTTLV
jgi:hypothetical protein